MSEIASVPSGIMGNNGNKRRRNKRQRMNGKQNEDQGRSHAANASLNDGKKSEDQGLRHAVSASPNDGNLSHQIGVNKKQESERQKDMQESVTGWYIVDVLNVGNLNETMILIQALLKPILLMPYNVQLSENMVLTFLIDSFNAATLLMKKSKANKIDGFKLNINVTDCSPDHFKIIKSVSVEMKEKIEEAITFRFNSDTKCLDLSKFHSSPGFTNNQMFVPLNQSIVFSTTLNIAAKYTGQNVFTLILENNNIYKDHGLEWISRLFPNLKVLMLSNNKLSKLKMLKNLAQFPIKELYLAHNVFNQTKHFVVFNPDHIQQVQQYFPMIYKLDDMELIPAPQPRALPLEQNEPTLRNTSKPNDQYSDFGSLFHIIHDKLATAVDQMGDTAEDSKVGNNQTKCCPCNGTNYNRKQTEFIENLGPFLNAVMEQAELETEIERQENLQGNRGTY